MRNATSPASSTTNGLTLYRPRRAPAELPMNVVYVVYIARMVVTPLPKENQGLEKHGNPRILLLHSRSQRSQRTRCSFLNPQALPSQEPLWLMAVGPMALRASRDCETRN